MKTDNNDITDANIPDAAFDESLSVLRRLAEAAFPVAIHQEPLQAAGPDPTAQDVDAPEIPSIWTDQTYTGLLEALPDGVVIVNQAGRMVLVNAQLTRLFGYERDDLLNKPIELLVPERFRPAHVAYRTNYFDDPHVRPMGANVQLFGRRKDGTEFPVEISLSPLRAEVGVHAIGTVRDISEKQRLEARYRTLVEEIPAVTFMASLDGGISELYVSPQIQELLGFSQEEWLENPILWYSQLHEEDRDRWHAEFAKTLNSAERFQSVYRFRARDGRVVWVHGEANVVHDSEGRPLFLQGVAFDITDRKEAEEALRHARDELEVKVEERTAQIRASLRVRDRLLADIHHRVKNNLQTVDNMLWLQGENFEHPEAQRVMKECQNRIQTMSRIHNLLYKSSDISKIEFAQYAQPLAQDVIQLWRSDIDLDVNVNDVVLDIDSALYSGLIINELVTNCCKYAFPDEQSGRISITMQLVENGKCQLIVADDGVGIPAELDLENAASVGLQLVDCFADKLEATVQLDRSQGTSFTITFSPSPDIDGG